MEHFAKFGKACFADLMSGGDTISKATSLARGAQTRKLVVCEVAEKFAPSSGKVTALIQSVLSQPQSTRDFLHRIYIVARLAARAVRYRFA